MELNWGILGWNLAALAILMTLGWLVSLPSRNVTVVDSLWGLGFVLAAWVTFALADGYAGRRWLVTVLTTLWGLSLLSVILNAKRRQNITLGHGPQSAKR